MERRSSADVSTQTLLNALHSSFASNKPYSLESATSLVVNSWVTATSVRSDGESGYTVDRELGRRAWEHARRRAEHGCIVLGSLHVSTPSVLLPFVSSLPFSVPSSLCAALDVVKAFTSCVTPLNDAYPRYSSLATIFEISPAGDLTGASIKLSSAGLDMRQGLLDIPSEPGFRAFDVFYYLFTPNATSTVEREFLNLKHPSDYKLLSRSGTYEPPSYLPTTDDAASAETFRKNLKAIGIKGETHCNLISALAGILELGEALEVADFEALGNVCEQVAPLLDMDPRILSEESNAAERETFIAGLYEKLVDWVIAAANEAIASEVQELTTQAAIQPSDDGSVTITVIDIPKESLGKAVCLRTVFDVTQGINLEMKEDGVPLPNLGSSAQKVLKKAISESASELGITNNSLGELEREQRATVLQNIGVQLEDDCFLKTLLLPDGEESKPAEADYSRFDLLDIVSSNRMWFHLSLHPTDLHPSQLSTSGSAWSAGAVSRQLREWILPEWSNWRTNQLDFTADFDFEEFASRYAPIGCLEGHDGIENWALGQGWASHDVVLGQERVYIRETPWWEAETLLDLNTTPNPNTNTNMNTNPGLNAYYEAQSIAESARASFVPYNPSPVGFESTSAIEMPAYAPTGPALSTRSVHPPAGDYGLGTEGDAYGKGVFYDDSFNPNGHVATEQPISAARKWWVRVVWALTFWIPSPLLKYIGRMKRPDVRMAWREKLVICFIIALFNGLVIFYMVGFSDVLCPGKDKVWNAREVEYHQGENDFYVSFRGKVYDLTDFWTKDHSDTAIQTTKDRMLPFAGTDFTRYAVPPLTVACPGFVKDNMLTLQPNVSLTFAYGAHVSGNQSTYTDSVMANNDWYMTRFLPKMKEMKVGDLVVKRKTVKNDGKDGFNNWVILNGHVYDLTDYFFTLDTYKSNARYTWLPDVVTEMIKDNVGKDITDLWNKNLNSSIQATTMECFDNLFYAGKTDFRDSPRCTVNNYIMLAFTIIVCSLLGAKFLAALQLGSKRHPTPQDRFVICQIPAYTEGEEHLRKSIQSLTALTYDNKRKLICVICDGMIVGSGNDRPTPKIVLDILGVDPSTDPPALPFQSIGQGNEQLNYGKVYSGLFEYEGNVVPYMVVVKVGKQSEAFKPGNRGKRDSQVLLMRFLNRVHHRTPMSPLELEMFHQLNNVIGVNPELYEYLLMVDADTTVREDSLTRLVAGCTTDIKVAGICGETTLENAGKSWWTFIQVYEYYISHHLSKAFESLFGSVTCLPGCFSMYRLRTSDKGRPLIIADSVINDYSDCNIDTLHKKNLLSLGEDRFLTTIMLKYFPKMSYKFIPDARAFTSAPDTWGILMSQRRRWINSTIHNLGELIFIDNICGVCCFSMRFVILMDLFSTAILPATCFYLVYLFYNLATKNGPLPIVSIVMLCAVYGLQALIFIIKRRWEHIGWMIFYFLAIPFYFVALPIYSFWKQDDFSWGNTRVVVGEKGKKQVVDVHADAFNPLSIPHQCWDDYALANNLPGRRTNMYHDDPGSTYSFKANDSMGANRFSAYTSVRPASAMSIGTHHRADHGLPQMVDTAGASQLSLLHTYSSVPQSRAMSTNHTVLSNRYSGKDQIWSDNRMSTMGTGYDHSGIAAFNTDIENQSTTRRNHDLFFQQRAASQLIPDTQNDVDGLKYAQIQEAIRECLRQVDMNSITKRQLKLLVEERLQISLDGKERMVLDQMIDDQLASM